MFKWLLKKYKKLIIIFIAFCIIFPIFLYLILLPNTPIPAGSGLKKSDWLVFLGTYLSFVGTVVVSVISTASSSYHSEMESKRRAEERHKEIQPIFIVEVISIDQLPPGTGEAFNPYLKDGMPKHKNVVIQIENESKYPAKHVIIFNDCYFASVIRSREKRTICVGYEDSPDVSKWPKEVIGLLKSEHSCDEQGIPKEFNINYEDIDGRQMVQTFRLSNFGNKKYYSRVEEPWEV